MRFQEGKILKKNIIEKTGKEVKVIFRYPRMSDAEQLLNYINKAMKETDFLAMFKKLNLSQEKKWLKNMIKMCKEKNSIYIVIEINNKIIGSANLERDILDSRRHIGIFRIGINQQYTKLGLGPVAAKLLFNLGKNMGIELVKSSYFHGNKPSKKLHYKLGFKVIGRIPKARKRGKKYSDEITLYKPLGR